MGKHDKPSPSPSYDGNYLVNFYIAVTPNVPVTVILDDGQKSVAPSINGYWYSFKILHTKLSTKVTVIPIDSRWEMFEGSFVSGSFDRSVKIDLVAAYEKREGIVHAASSVAQDDNGNFNPLGASLFWAPWAFRNDLEKLKNNLQYLAEGNVNYIRAFLTVGSENPNDSWYDRRNDGNFDISAYIDFCYDNYGIRNNICIFAGLDYFPTRSERSAYVDKVINAIKGREHKVIYVQLANEYFKNYNILDEIRDFTRRIQNALPSTLVSPSSPLEWQAEINTLYGGNIGNLLTMHLERTDGEKMWKYVRKPYELRQLDNCPIIRVNEEGQGQASSGESDDNPLRQAFYGILGYVTGVAFHTIHTRPGVRGGGSYDIQHFGPWIEIYDSPNLDAIIDGINYARRVLPSDITNYRIYNGNRSEHLLPAKYIWPDGFDEGCTRCYMALNGSMFAMPVIGILNRSIHVAQVPMKVKVHDVLNEKVIIDTQLNVGDNLELIGHPDTIAAYLVIGTY